MVGGAMDHDISREGVPPAGRQDHVDWIIIGAFDPPEACRGSMRCHRAVAGSPYRGERPLLEARR